ncbi:MAG: cytochrome c biogenesis protein ResB [Candidatus Coatesbacteria bacterium]|nr:MAG: cytochrome c biogenesis protein ResB [Candidatus Coatesbacteria bacterium]
MRSRWLSITRLVAVYLLLALAGLTLVAVFVPQGRGPAYYEVYYEEWWANTLVTSGLANLFSVWYYYALAGIVVFAFALYSAGRLGMVFAAGRRGVRPEKFRAQAAVGPVVTEENAEDLLVKLPFAWRKTSAGWLGRRGRLAVVGTAVAAVGAVLTFAAAIARLSATSDDIFLFQGYDIALPPAFGPGYELRAEEVAETVDPNTRQLLSSLVRLRLFRAGEEVASGDVAVNRPFRHSGFDVYLESAEPAGVRGLRLEAVRLKPGAAPASYGRAEFAWEVGRERGAVELAPREETVLGNTGLRFRYAEYVERFATTESGFSDDGDEYNPAAFVQFLNLRGEQAFGLLFKNRPEESFVRSEAADFAPQPFEIRYAADAGPWRTDRREYLFASGAYLSVGTGAEPIAVAMGSGGGTDLRGRSLAAAVERGDGRREEVALPFGVRVPVGLGEGAYLLRFLGAGAAPVAALRVRNRADFTIAWIGGGLILLGLVLAAAFRYEELQAYVREGTLYLGGWGAGAADRDAFERWLALLRGGRA